MQAITKDNRQAVEKIAHAIYRENVTLDMWAEEQDHVKYAYWDQAEKLIALLEGAGFSVVEFVKKVEVARQEPEEPKRVTKKEKDDRSTKPLDSDTGNGELPG